MIVKGAEDRSAQSEVRGPSGVLDVLLRGSSAKSLINHLLTRVAETLKSSV